MEAEAHAQAHEPRDLRDLLKELIATGEFGLQKDIAERAGMTSSALSQVLNPERPTKRQPPIDFLRDVVEAMGKTMEWFLVKGNWLPPIRSADTEATITDDDELEEEDAELVIEVYRRVKRRRDSREREDGLGRTLR